MHSFYASIEVTIPTKVFITNLHAKFLCDIFKATIPTEAFVTNLTNIGLTH